MFPISPWDLNSLTFFHWVKLVFHYTGAQLLAHRSPRLRETPDCMALGMMLMFWTQFLDHGSRVALMWPAA